MNTIKKSIKKVILSSTFVLILTLNTSCNSQTNSITDKATKINEIVSLYSDYEGFNGAVLVAHKGEVIYKKGFGSANMEWEIPNQTDTKFKIGSITKPFTAMLIMQLVAEGKLDLHEPISTYLLDYPKEQGNKITIHHLLTHTSGISRDIDVEDRKHNVPKEMVNQFANGNLKFEPGKRFSYSNSGYTLLGYIIETITEKTYEEVLKEKIFAPLNMKNSGFYRHNTIIKSMSSGYYKNWGNYFDEEHSDKSSAYAAGAIYSTVEDMFLWDKAMNTETLLPKKYMNLLFKKHIVDSNAHYGYGWEIRDKSIGNTSEKIETIGHSGSIGGFRSLYTRIPSNNSSIIFLNNTNRAFLTSMTTAITGILYDKSYDYPLKPLAMFMTREIHKNGIDKGILFYKKYKNLDEYYVSEQELVVEGYKLLHAGNAKDAAQVFKLSTEVFPNKDNSYDSYAEALMELGKNEEAIINYKKSLELNPKNNNAIEILKKLGVTYSTDILDANDTWGKELFAIPLHFAKDIKLKGFEDARFPKGWNDTASPNFWTYAFAWKVNIDKTLTVNNIEEYLKKYYDGLLSGVNKENDLELPKTKVEIAKNSDDDFIGIATIYDTFTTRKPLVLNFHIEQVQCKKNNESIIVFRISPKNFNHNVWDDLNEIKIIKSSCD